MISPRGGRLHDERLREDSDPEEEILQPSSAVYSSEQARQRRRGGSLQTNLTWQTSVRVQAAGAGNSAPAAVQPPSQNLIGLEEGVGLAPASSPSQPVLQHNNSLWQRRRSVHVRNNSVHGPVAGAGATGDGNLGAGERVQLENEAPIRGLAKDMSLLEIPHKPKKPNLPHLRHTDGNSGNNNTAGSWLMGVHIRHPSRTQPTVHASHPSTQDEPAAAVSPVPASASILPSVIRLSRVLETGDTGGNASKHGGGAGHGLFDPAELGTGHGKGSGSGGPVGPETPPPLRGLNRRDSLVSQRGEEEPPEEIEQDLMIGEIKNISMNEELVLVRQALVFIILSCAAARLVREFIGPVAEGTDLDIIYLVGFVAALLLSFPVIRFIARAFAYAVTTRASRVLYRGNRYYFIVALHYDIAITVWSIFSVVFWREMFHEWVYTAEEHASVVVQSCGDKILQCHMALRIGILVKNFVVLLVATSYLWRPYLRRVQSSILAQYILLLLTDYCTKGVCNSDDQNFALEMGKQGIQDKKNISLYAVSKAMGFIPRNKLGHSFFREIGGSDTLDSSKDATLLGSFLFEQLILRSRLSQSPPPRRDMTLAALGGSDPGPMRLRVRERFNTSPSQRSWRFITPKRYGESITRSFFFQPPSAVEPADTVANHHSGNSEEEETKDRRDASSGPQPPSGSADIGEGDGSMSITSEEGEDEPEVLERKTFCPALHPDLLKVAFKIFDLDHNGTITREEMVHGVVGTFKDHRSLALTLKDSEHIARKLGLIITAIIIFILIFVWLSIWGADVVQLSVTFASFLIAISFMIGTTASNLVTSVLFIFVTRLYDVGDRVHIYDSSQTTSAPTDVTVAKINLLTTAFKRWDEQVFYMPNYLLASKTVVNIQRSAHQWHEFWIQITSNTPTRKIKALHTWLQKFAKSKDKPEGLYSRMGFSLSNIENTNKLTIRITFRQRGNWQSAEKKWACQSMCTWAIKNGCDSIGISYSLPDVPIKVKEKLI